MFWLRDTSPPSLHLSASYIAWVGFFRRRFLQVTNLIFDASVYGLDVLLIDSRPFCL